MRAKLLATYRQLHKIGEDIDYFNVAPNLFYRFHPDEQGVRWAKGNGFKVEIRSENWEETSYNMWIYRHYGAVIKDFYTVLK